MTWYVKYTFDRPLNRNERRHLKSLRPLFLSANAFGIALDQEDNSVIAAQLEAIMLTLHGVNDGRKLPVASVTSGHLAVPSPSIRMSEPDAVSVPQKDDRRLELIADWLVAAMHRDEIVGDLIEFRGKLRERERRRATVNLLTTLEFIDLSWRRPRIIRFFWLILYLLGGGGIGAGVVALVRKKMGAESEEDRGR